VKVKGVLIYTVLRGRLIAEDHVAIGKPGYGEFIPPLKLSG
jgi:hypothetical protein